MAARTAPGSRGCLEELAEIVCPFQDSFDSVFRYRITRCEWNSSNDFMKNRLGRGGSGLSRRIVMATKARASVIGRSVAISVLSGRPERKRPLSQFSGRRSFQFRKGFMKRYTENKESCVFAGVRRPGKFSLFLHF
ncbi:hypothetical protein CDAR_319251 [Caerostris darwini]|uniref:Uncharacterized protein n=1 Tax=Caerostris darwini TaxID=1538125 RepID=A0AAV4TXH2_9ARAC|nr:hypothetical protein CDAR_319251 [Caerostris darwini]